MDYGHDVEFGVFLTPEARRAPRVVELAVLAEDVGLDLVTIQDHPYQAKFLDAWTLLSVIGARTQRVRVSPNVANLPLRPPAVLATSVASLDLLTGGRVELGLGAGGFADAIAAMGGPRRSPREAVDALAEAIAIVRAMWDVDGGPVAVDGEHYRVRGVHPGPAPAHDVGIWLGAYKPRMLALTGRAADGWLPSSSYLDLDRLGELNATIDDAAREAGREPAAIRRLLNITGSFTGDGSSFLGGPPEVWVEQLAELTLEHGTSAFVLTTDTPDEMRRFAAEVAPAVRELVAAERAPARAETATPEIAAPTTATASAAGALLVAPTPDPGVRLSGERVWDESTRPHREPPDPGRAYTRHEQAAGRHLIDVHDGLRGELERVRDLVGQVITGRLDPGAARGHINEMTMRQNDWTAGVYCAQYCRVVTTHHTIEDATMFPHLRRADPALRPVIDRLEEEHKIIHDVLENVDRALVEFVTPGSDPRPLQTALDLLSDALLSHLSYEERELVEPLARLGFH